MLLIAFVSPVFYSCKKKIYGCTDPNALNYSEVATEDGKDCVYKEAEKDEVYSSRVNNVAWTLVGNEWKIILNWSEITQEVLNKGAIQTFLGDVGYDNWSPVPATFYQSSTYSTSILVNYSLNNVEIIWVDSDLTPPLTPPNVDVKVVISL